MLNGYSCISAGNIGIIEYFIMDNNKHTKDKLWVCTTGAVAIMIIQLSLYCISKAEA